jgi:hypothetical protein
VTKVCSWANGRGLSKGEVEGVMIKKTILVGNGIIMMCTEQRSLNDL